MVLDYTAGTTDAGLSAYLANQVDFAASDVAVPPAQLPEGLVQSPAVGCHPCPPPPRAASRGGTDKALVGQQERRW